MFVNRLAFVIVFGMSGSIRSGDRLGGFVGFEPEIALLMFESAILHTKAGVTEHKVVMSLKVFRVNGQHVFKFLDGFRVLLLQKQHTPRIITRDAILWILRQDSLQMLQRSFVIPFFFQHTGIKVMGTRKVWSERQRALQHLASPCEITLDHARAPDIDPPVRIVRSDPGHGRERGFGALQVSLQEQADPIVVPTHPVLGGRCRIRRRLGGVAHNGQRGRVFRQSHDRQIGYFLDLSGHFGGIPGERKLTIVIARRGRRRTGNPLTGKRELRIEPGKLAVLKPGLEMDLTGDIGRNFEPVMHGIGSARRNQPHIDERTCGPCIALVDRVAVLIELERTIEVGAGIDRPLAVVLNRAT